MSVITSPAFWVPVTIRLPGDDGKVETIACRGRFKRLKKAERQQLDRRVRNNPMLPAHRESLRKALADDAIKMTAYERAEVEADIACDHISDLEILQTVLVDWEFKDLQGETIPFTPANLVLYADEVDGLEAAFVSAYYEARRKAANAGEQEKNSGKQSATT